jgi:hypothetical protein
VEAVEVVQVQVVPVVEAVGVVVEVEPVVVQSQDLTSQPTVHCQFP